MKLSGRAVPLRHRRERPGEPSMVRCSLSLSANEALMMHNLAAMVDIERAAFFAARHYSADVSVKWTGA